MTKLLDIQAEIAKLQKQASEIKSKEFESTVADILMRMEAFGITVKDLQKKQPKGKTKLGRPAKLDKVPRVKDRNKVAGKPVAIKYKGPNGESWTGRGIAPKWMSAAIAAGATKESFLIESTSA